MSEAEFQQQVIALARLYRYRVYHTHDSRRSQAGFPDLVLVRGKRLLFVELKTDTGRLTPEQYEWMVALLAAGQHFVIWRPADWDEIKATLAREDT